MKGRVTCFSLKSKAKMNRHVKEDMFKAEIG
jgi:hypothetical protein